MQMPQSATDQMIDPDIGNDGERCLPELTTPFAIEHLHRYAIAQAACRGKTVLDVACGEGYGSALLAAVAQQVTGVDISETTISHSRQRYVRDNLTFLVGRAEAIPLPQESVDVVVSFETLEHLADHDRMLSEVKRVLRPGGLLLMSTPDRRHYPDLRLTNNHRVSNPYHVRELDASEFRELIGRYFSHCRFLSQRLIGGSLMAPEEDAAGFTNYSGDFSHITIQAGDPIFKVCYASDSPVGPLVASVFESSNTWDALVARPLSKLREHYEHNRSFRLGRALTSPLRLLRGALRG